MTSRFIRIKRKPFQTFRDFRDWIREMNWKAELSRSIKKRKPCWRSLKTSRELSRNKKRKSIHSLRRRSKPSLKFRMSSTKLIRELKMQRSSQSNSSCLNIWKTYRHWLRLSRRKEISWLSLTSSWRKRTNSVLRSDKRLKPSFL